MDDLTLKELKKRLRSAKRELRDLETRRCVVVEEADSGDFDPSVMNATHRLLLSRIRECRAEIDRLGQHIEIQQTLAKGKKQKTDHSAIRAWLLSSGNAIGAAILILACALLYRACNGLDPFSTLNVSITVPNYQAARDQVAFSIQNPGDTQIQVCVPVSRGVTASAFPLLGIQLEVRSSNGVWFKAEGTEGSWICRGEQPLDATLLDLPPGRIIPVVLDIGKLKSAIPRPEEIRLTLQSPRGSKVTERTLIIPKPSQKSGL